MAGGNLHVAGGEACVIERWKRKIKLFFRAAEGVRNFSFGGGDPNRHPPPESSAP